MGVRHKLLHHQHQPQAYNTSPGGSVGKGKAHHHHHQQQQHHHKAGGSIGSLVGGTDRPTHAGHHHHNKPRAQGAGAVLSNSGASLSVHSRRSPPMGTSAREQALQASQACGVLQQAPPQHTLCTPLDTREEARNPAATLSAVDTELEEQEEKGAHQGMPDAQSTTGAGAHFGADLSQLAAASVYAGALTSVSGAHNRHLHPHSVHNNNANHSHRGIPTASPPLAHRKRQQHARAHNTAAIEQQVCRLRREKGIIGRGYCAFSLGQTQLPLFLSFDGMQWRCLEV